MRLPSYQFNRRYSTRYTFTSKGKKGAVLKMVEFTPTSVKNIFNLGFGDMLPDGRIDDTVNTNNHDVLKVMATMVEIIKDFTLEFPGSRVIFTGSSSVRTTLYQRILKTYYKEFSQHFVITGLIKTGSNFSEIPFEPADSRNFLAFLIKRKE